MEQVCIRDSSFSIKSQIGSSVSSIVLSANTTTEQKAGSSLVGIIFACLYSPSFRVVRVLGNLLTSFKLMPNVRTISVSEASPPIGVLSPSPTLSVITESMKSLPSIWLVRPRREESRKSLNCVDVSMLLTPP